MTENPLFQEVSDSTGPLDDLPVSATGFEGDNGQGEGVPEPDPQPAPLRRSLRFRQQGPAPGQ